VTCVDAVHRDDTSGGLLAPPLLCKHDCALHAAARRMRDERDLARLLIWRHRDRDILCWYGDVLRLPRLQISGGCARPLTGTVVIYPDVLHRGRISQALAFRSV